MTTPIVSRVADGLTTTFDFAFPFLDREHVKVYLGGDISPFSWVNNSRIQITPAPVSGAVVTVRRETPPVEPNVLQNNKPIPAALFNRLLTQAVYFSEERPGLPGLPGPTGPAGLTGASGPQGPQGIQGPTGPVGPQGLIGMTGPQGAVGPVGATGARGPSGADGSSFTVSFSGPYSARPTYDGQPAGFSFLATDQGNLYIRQGAVGGWSSAIPFGKGNKGDKGDTGDTGPQGPQGTTDYAALTNLPASFPPSTHNHNSLYYTKSEIDAMIAALAPKVNPTFTGTITCVGIDSSGSITAEGNISAYT